MKNWFKKRRTEIIIFFLALIPRLVFMFVAFFILGDNCFIKDADVYLPIGLNLLRYGVYANILTRSLAPSSFPAPGYPILLAFSWLIIPRFLFIVFWQNIMFSLFVVFIYKFAKLFFNNFISIGAALFMAFEPFSIFWSNMVMSETPFLLFLMLSIYFMALFWQKQKGKHLIYSSVLLGLAALIRQIAVFFFPAAIMIFIIIFWQKVSWRKILRYSVVYLIVFLAVISPWCIRNKIQFDTFTISNQTHFLYFFTASRDFLILSKGMSQTEADAYLHDLAAEKAGVNNFDEIIYIEKYIPVLKKISFSLIENQPFTYFKWHIVKALPVLTDSGWLNILSFWGTDLNQSQSISLSNLLVQKNIKAIILALKANQFFLIRILGVVFWLFIDIIAFLGLVLMLRKKELFRIALIMFIIIGYFVFTSSWAAMARLRLSFQPFLFIFLFYAIYIFLERAVF